MKSIFIGAPLRKNHRNPQSAIRHPQEKAESGRRKVDGRLDL
jgi:hypothetical protein